MLSFEKVIYEDILEELKNYNIDLILINANKSAIQKYSLDKGIAYEDIVKQIKLHAPQFESRFYTYPNFLCKNIFPILDKIFKDYPKTLTNYLHKSGANLISLQSKIIVEKNNLDEVFYIVDDNKNKLAFRILEVPSSIGDLIEEKLHYLRNIRPGSVYRIGIFIENKSWPICYMNFCDVDRNDKVLALSKSLNRTIPKQNIIELTRVFGCGNLPRNTISFLIGYMSKKLRSTQYDYIITAVNATLGFTGNSMLASNFVPYAVRPVKYNYDVDGRYCTIRNNQVYKNSVSQMPPNLLYVREIKQSTNKLNFCKLVDISNNFSFNETAIEHKIHEIRKELESVWNEKTRYHGTKIGDVYHISKGQCGVSSLLLAKVLEKLGYEVRFCEGDAIFPNKKTSIFNHCWLKVINYNKRGKNVIIDITADQNGFWQKVLFKTENDLRKLHINYVVKYEKSPNEVDVEHMIKRLEYLELELNTKEKLNDK